MRSLALATGLSLAVLSAPAGAGDEPTLVAPLRHANSVTAVAFSPDGRLSASGSADKTLKLWDVQSGRLVRTLTGHSAHVSALAFSPDGARIASGSWDFSVRIWSVATGEELRVLSGHTKPVNDLVWSRDGAHLASASTDRTVQIWPVDRAGPPRVLPGSSMVLSAAFSPDGSQVATGHDDKQIVLWDAKSGAELRRLSGHASSVQAVRFLPDGRLLSASVEGTLRRWDPATGELLGEHKLGGQEPLKALAIAPDGRHVAVAVGRELQWVALDGMQVAARTRSGALLTAVAVSPDGRFVLFGDLSMGLHLFGPATRELRPSARGNTAPVRAVAFGAGDRTVVALTGRGTVLLDRARGSLRRLDAGGRTLTLSPDRRHGAFGREVGAEIVDLETGATVTRIGDEARSVNGLAYAPDGRVLALAAAHEARLALHQLPSGETLKSTPPEYMGSRDAVTVTPDGKTLLVGRIHSVELWDLAELRKLRDLTEHKHSISALVVTPDAEHVLSASGDRTLRLTELATGRVRWEATHGTSSSSHVNGAALSPDGRLAASAGGDGVIKLWDATTGAELPWATPPRAHSSLAMSVSFSGDGKLLASGGVDGTVRLFDVSSRTEVAQLIALAEPADAWLLTTPDGYYFATKSALEHIHFVKGTKVIGLDQFDLEYNRPDLVLGRLGMASPGLLRSYAKAWEKRLQRLGFDPARFEGQRSFDVPEIELAAASAPLLEVTEPRYPLSFVAKDARHALDRVFVTVNGVPLHGVKGMAVTPSPTKEAKIALEVPLSAGKNTIKVSVLNERGVESIAERVEVTYSPPTPVVRDLHVFAVGVSEFAERQFNLTYAHKDARDLARFFSGVKGRYGKVHVHTLVNREATRAAVLGLRGALDATRVDDDVVFFIASHGVLDDGLDYYLAMHDMSFAEPAKGGLRYDELEQLLDAIPARNKLVLIDACHSGEVDKEEGQGTAGAVALAGGVKSRGLARPSPARGEGIGLASSFELMRALFADLKRNNGAVVISSAAGREYAFEGSSWSNGVFTYAVLDGLKGGRADENQDRSVRVSELRAFVSERVQSLTGGRQNPTSRTENLENDFGFALR